MYHLILIHPYIMGSLVFYINIKIIQYGAVSSEILWRSDVLITATFFCVAYFYINTTKHLYR
jgi:hypothetical protein